MRLLPHHRNNFLLHVFAVCGLICLAAQQSYGIETPGGEYQGAPTLWSADSSGETSPSIVNVSKQVYRLIVENDGMIKGGTAFLVSGNRIIATNNHVVESGRAFALGYVGDQSQTRWVKLRLLAVFPQKDLALLESSEDLPGQALPLAADYPELASDLYAIGFPAAADLGSDVDPAQRADRNFVLPSVLKGNISRVMTGVWLTNQLQHQTPISPGYSGGPLVDTRGVVVGVSTAINKEANGISYGVAAQDLSRFLSACAITPRNVHIHAYPAVSMPETTSTVASIAEKRAEPAVDDSVVKRGYQMLSRGDIAAARTIFEYAIQKGAGRGAYEGLAKTYDPAVLQALRVIGNLGNAEKAKELYERASRGSGDPKPVRSAAVTAASCDNSMCTMIENASGLPVVMCSKATATPVSLAH